MATVNDVVSTALRLLKVKDAESEITAKEARDGLESLNDMMNEWEEAGLETGFVTLNDVNATLEVPESTLGAIKAKLALYIAPEYEANISPQLMQRARMSFIRLRDRLDTIQGTEFPATLPVGSGNEEYFHSPNGDAPGDLVDRTFFPDNEEPNF